MSPSAAPRVFWALIAFAGCANASSPPSSSSSPPTPSSHGNEPRIAAPDAAPTTASKETLPPAPQATPFQPDNDPACAELATLTSELHLWQVAASAQPHWKKALALWPTLPPACRGGTYYLAAAQLTSGSSSPGVTTADGKVTVTSPADALARALAVEPDHPTLLAHLAFADDLVPGQAPALPADACATARARGTAWADDAAYVCALAAIHAGDGAAAQAELDHIGSANRFPDLQVRRAQALALAGKTKEARKLAKSAATSLASAPPRFDLTQAARDALKKKLAGL